MKRFDIRNKASGKITHSIKAEIFPGHDNGWGKTPDEYDVIETDVTAEIAAEAALKVDINTRRQQVVALLADWDNVTLPQLRQALRYLLKKDLRQ